MQDYTNPSKSDVAQYEAAEGVQAHREVFHKQYDAMLAHLKTCDVDTGPFEDAFSEIDYEFKEKKDAIYDGEYSEAA